MRRSEAQIIRHGRETLSEGMTSTKLRGTPAGLSTSKSAPLALTLRTVQEITAPPKQMRPTFKTRFRVDSLLSSATHLPDSLQPFLSYLVQIDDIAVFEENALKLGTPLPLAAHKGPWSSPEQAQRIGDDKE